MTKPALYGKGRDALRDAIVNRETFSTSGALSGQAYGETFTVFSYAEPIFRYTPATGWVQTLRRFSVTTSRHQGAVGGIIAINGETVTHTPERLPR